MSDDVRDAPGFNDDERARWATALTTISHEAITTLTILIGSSRTLAARWRELDADAVSVLLDMLVQRSESAVRQCTALITLARAFTGTLDVEERRVDLSMLLPGVIRRVEMTHPDGSIALRIEPEDPVVLGDPSRLADLLTDLLGGSFAGTREIVIDIRDDALEPSMLAVHIRPTGSGAPGFGPADARDPAHLLHVLIAERMLGRLRMDTRGIHLSLRRGAERDQSGAAGTV